MMPPVRKGGRFFLFFRKKKKGAEQKKGRGISSAGQSICFARRGSTVRIRYSPLTKRLFNESGRAKKREKKEKRRFERPVQAAHAKRRVGTSFKPILPKGSGR